MPDSKRPALTPGRDRRKRPQAPCGHHGLVPVLPDGELLVGAVSVVKVMLPDGSYAFRQWKSPGFNDHEAAWWLRQFAAEVMVKYENYADASLAGAFDDDDQEP